MRWVLGLVLILSVAAVVPALADVDGGDVDPLPVGPFPFGANGPSPALLGGDSMAPMRVTVVMAGDETGAPTIPQGSGNVLCLDNRQSTVPLIIQFTFSCSESIRTACQVSYDYTAAAWAFGGGFEVFVDDDGTLSNPDDLYRPPVGFPPSTTQGSKHFLAGDCDAAVHTLTFVVFPEGVLYLDNLETDCIDITTPTQRSSWSHLKALYRD